MNLRPGARIIGIDPGSKHTGVAVLAPQPDKLPARWLVRELTTMDDDPLDAGIKQHEMLRAILEDLKPQLAIIEDFAWGGRGNQTINVAIVQTCLRLTLRAYGVRYVTVAPTTMKKFVLGKGKGTKSQMVKAVEKRWKFGTKSDHIADAYGLSMIGIAACGEPVGASLSVKMAEAVAFVRKKLDYPDDPR